MTNYDNRILRKCLRTMLNYLTQRYRALPDLSPLRILYAREIFYLRGILAGLTIYHKDKDKRFGIFHCHGICYHINERIHPEAQITWTSIRTLFQ